jgi:hypothetical protein
MISALAIASLVFAAGSEGEASSEEVWARTFDTVNSLRERRGIPPLTLRERFSMVLGEPPDEDCRFGIGVEGDGDHPESYEIVRYDWINEPEVPGGGYWNGILGWASTHLWDDWKEIDEFIRYQAAVREAESLAKSLYILYLDL